MSNQTPSKILGFSSLNRTSKILLIILAVFIYIGMSKLMYHFVADMSQMTSNVTSMATSVNSLRSSVSSMSNDLEGMTIIIDDGQTAMSQDFRQIRIDLKTMTDKALLFEADISQITHDVGSINSQVSHMTKDTSQIQHEIKTMDTSMQHVGGDVLKMSSPEKLMPGLR